MVEISLSGSGEGPGRQAGATRHRSMVRPGQSGPQGRGGADTSERWSSHPAGAIPARRSQPGTPIVTPCDGQDGVRAEAGRQRVRRCVGGRTSEQREVQPRNVFFCRECPRRHGVGRQQHRPYPMACNRAMYSPGSRFAARLKRMTLKPGIPASSVGRRRPNSKGDRSCGPNAKRESESSVVAMTRGNE